VHRAQASQSLAHAPERLHEEITEDYNEMIYAETPEEIEKPAASSFQGAAGACCTAGLGAAIMQSRGPKWATVAAGLA
jgi:hypothetical protein